MALDIYVPPGIGDFSAMYAKLCGIEREIIVHPAADEPQRLSPFLDILPRIKNGGIAAHSANAALANTLPPGVDLSVLKDGDYFLSVNEWLESGHMIADWIPGKIDYHYPISISLERKAAVDTLMYTATTFVPKIGIYCSAYGNSRHWGFWGFEEWMVFLKKVCACFPENTMYVFIGAEYDVQISEHLVKWMREEGKIAVNAVGALHIASTTYLISKLDYFFVFPSGLGFLADVVRTPHLMWFPPNLKKMMGTFCDPEQYESGQTMHQPFATPDQAFENFKPALKRIEERL
jgi:hypothetical protein